MKNNKQTAPPFLRKGDLIGISCPASKISAESAKYGSEAIASWGYEVRMGLTLMGSYHNFSAPDEERVAELQQMLDDEKIKAVIFGRGGYGMLRILDRLDFSRFKEYPKWICGYSDITALHLHLFHQCGIQSLHSLMAGGITKENKANQYVNSLKTALEGKPLDYSFSAHFHNREGEAEGCLIGGNLSLLSALCGSASVPDMRGKILFIEDIGEHRYIIDRMMLTLKRAGWLDDLTGLIVGGFTESKDTEVPFGQTEYELIWEKVKEYDYPVAFGFPVGHQQENYALKEGAEFLLSVGEECTLKEI